MNKYILMLLLFSQLCHQQLKSNYITIFY